MLFLHIFFLLPFFRLWLKGRLCYYAVFQATQNLKNFKLRTEIVQGVPLKTIVSTWKHGESIRLREEAAADVTTMAAAMSRGVGCIWRRSYLYQAHELSSWMLCSCVVFCFVYICKEAALLRIHLCVQLPKDLEFIMVSHVFCLRLALCTWNTSRSEVRKFLGCIVSLTHKTLIG